MPGCDLTASSPLSLHPFCFAIVERVKVIGSLFRALCRSLGLRAKRESLKAPPSISCDPGVANKNYWPEWLQFRSRFARLTSEIDPLSVGGSWERS